MDSKCISKLIQRTIRKLDTANPFTICDMLGIIVIEKPLIDTRGVYHYFKRNKIICINSGLSDKERMFVCAHELGHALMHTKINSLFLSKNTFFETVWYEIEANQFAMQLLEVYAQEFGGNIE